MKKVLFATTALVLTAGAAAAEVKISGYGRMGLQHVEGRGGPTEAGDDAVKDTQVYTRLRFNIDAYKETDSGVTFGGRIRLQYQNNVVSDYDDIFGNRSGSNLSAAYLYAAASGFRVEVGNANSAVDSMATLHNSEFGFTNTTQGSYNLISYGEFQTYPYRDVPGNGMTETNRMGVFLSYETGGLIGRLSYHTPDQAAEDLPDGYEDELQISLDYKSGPFKVGFGYAANGEFVDGDNSWVITGEYAIDTKSSVGIHLLGFETDQPDETIRDDNTGVTIYGRTEFNGVGVGGFISTSDVDNGSRAPYDGDYLTNDLAFGIGAEYDLGGAFVKGTIQQTLTEDLYVDAGVQFFF